MQVKTLLKIGLPLAAFTFYIFGFRSIGNPSTEALQTVTNQFHLGLKDFERNVKIYQEEVDKLLAGADNYQAIQTAQINTRLSFKKVEFLLEFIDHYSIKKYINGAPLPSVEPKVPEIRVIEPSGLQVMDELAFADVEDYDPKELKNQVDELADRLSKVIKYQSVQQLQHRFVFEGARQEIIRIFTLGLTGFDTPGSINAIPEAIVALQSLADALQAYGPAINRADKGLNKALQLRFDQAIAYLKDHQDFDSFDRLHFLKEYTNPLYALVYRTQRNLGVETVDEVEPRPTAVNTRSTNLFDPEYLNAPHFAGMAAKEVTAKRVELGRLLFFDPILSVNNQRACASCHNPDKGFTDGLDKSLAINGHGKILRNAPTVINSVYAERYFYDLREDILARQIKHVVLDDKEFATDFFEIADKLKQSEEYRQLFAAAYPEHGESAMLKYGLSHALAAYISTLKGFNSPFDQYVRGERDEIHEDVQAGFNLFMGKAACGTCHFAPVFNGLVPPYYEESESEILGVTIHPDSTILDSDLGRWASGRPTDEADFYYFSFKTPTVRNAELTAPYMHNGAYPDLESVVNFYNHGGGAGLGMDIPYQTLPPDSLGLNNREIHQLVQFMESLTDTTGVTMRPVQLPSFANHPEWNNRTIGGDY